MRTLLLWNSRCSCSWLRWPTIYICVWVVGINHIEKEHMPLHIPRLFLSFASLFEESAFTTMPDSLLPFPVSRRENVEKKHAMQRRCCEKDENGRFYFVDLAYPSTYSSLARILFCGLLEDWNSTLPWEGQSM